ncbi:hypothetical protein EON83_22275 [bacterium]|nr:MAG: hypothetical protein EON83_22275 [bacterium]
MKILGTFYGFEQKLGASGYFKFYVSKDELHAAWLSERDVNSEPEHALQTMGAQGSAGQKARQLEMQYDQDVALGANWQTRHKQNFSMRREEISRMMLLPFSDSEDFPTVYAKFYLQSGKKARSFYVVGEENRQAVRALLETLAPVETTIALPFIGSIGGDVVSAVPAEPTRNSNSRSWLWAVLLGVVSCAVLYATFRSPLALIGLLGVFRFRAMFDRMGRELNAAQGEYRAGTESLQSGRRDARF